MAHPEYTSKVVARFDSHVDRSAGPDACHLWQADKSKRGYGRTRIGGKNYYAHCVSWEMANGGIPEGLRVLHNCPDGDNPSCVNPRHLWLGTLAENMADMVAKGRQARGDRHGSRLYPERLPRGDQHIWRIHPERRPRGIGHGMALLDEAQVLEIRRLYQAGGVTYVALAARYGVTKSAIGAIVRGAIWRHLLPPR